MLEAILQAIKKLFRLVTKIVTATILYIAFVITAIMIVGIFPGATYVSENGTRYIHSELSTSIMLLPFAINVGILITKKVRKALKDKVLKSDTMQKEQPQDLSDRSSPPTDQINHEYASNNTSIPSPLIEAICLILETQQASVSMLQRKMHIGYKDGAQIIDRLEEFGVIGPFSGASPRLILVDSKEEAFNRCIKSMQNNYEIEKNIEQNESTVMLLSKVGLVDGLDVFDLDAMKVITALENNLQNAYKDFFRSAMPASAGCKMFAKIENACNSSRLPLAAEIRTESLLEEYRHKFENPNPLSLVDQMAGHDFEEWCATLLLKNGFTQVQVTKASGDQGVDVLAVKDDIHYAIQCKCYTSNLGNTPVQEIHAGKKMYRCQIGVVMTNSYFTTGARDLADTTGILLWDRDKLQQMIDTAQW